MRTRDTPASGVTVQVVTRVERRVGLGHHSTRLGFGDLHPVVAAASTGGHFEAGDRAGADAPRLDFEVRERGREEMLVVLLHIGDVAVDGLGGALDPSFSGDVNGSHTGVFSTTQPWPCGRLRGERSDFDRAELSDGMLGGDLDRLVQIGAFDDVEPADVLLGLGERTVG